MVRVESVHVEKIHRMVRVEAGRLVRVERDQHMVRVGKNRLMVRVEGN